jgi:hypothetical protein
MWWGAAEDTSGKFKDHHRQYHLTFNIRQRWQVEPTIAWLVRYDGSRRARRVGLAAAQCQLWQACAVRNLWRWLGRQARRQRVRTAC